MYRINCTRPVDMNTYNQARQKEISAIQSIVELRQLDFNPITELPAILSDARKFCKAKGVVITLFTSKKYWVKSSINFEESLFVKYFTEMISNEWHTAQDKAVQVFGGNLNNRFIAVPIFDANQCKIGAICFEEPNLKTISKSSDLYFKSLATSVELLFQKELMKCKYESSIDLLERNKQLLLKKENLIKYTHDHSSQKFS